MEWEKCVTMVELSNKRDDKFYDFVLENLSEIQGQSLQMLISGIELIEENITKRVDFFNAIIEHIDQLDEEVTDMRTIFRIGFMKDLVQEHSVNS
jgi:hypothetical protein